MVPSPARPGLNERDMALAKLDEPRGILHVKGSGAPRGHARYMPAADVAPFVEHFWVVEWDVSEPEVAEVLAHPSVHLTIETGGSGVRGVVTGKFTTVLTGSGRVLGTKFRPGGFRPFLRVPVSTLTDRKLTLDALFGKAAADLERQVLARRDHGEAIEVVQTFLRGRRPALDPTIELVAGIAARVAADREITKVEQLVREHGIGLRRLQRLFDEYVGVSPKWVIQRYRLHEAAERIAAGTVTDFAALALDLGYADQAHFIRDFRRVVGSPPASYGRSLASPAAGRS
jgi:AraC-like DNA-binding protein